MTKFVVYSSPDEIIVTTVADEQNLLDSPYQDRDFDEDYDRMVVEDVAVYITSRMRWE